MPTKKDTMTEEDEWLDVAPFRKTPVKAREPEPTHLAARVHAEVAFNESGSDPAEFVNVPWSMVDKTGQDSLAKTIDAAIALITVEELVGARPDLVNLIGSTAGSHYSATLEAKAAEVHAEALEFGRQAVDATEGSDENHLRARDYRRKGATLSNAAALVLEEASEVSLTNNRRQTWLTAALAPGASPHTSQS
jgi:hypothetical protein